MTPAARVLVFTDLHLLEPGGRIGHLDPDARFRAALAHALANQPEAECIVITGDLTHHGRPAQYAQLRAALADCPLPVHLMLGNHDRRAAFRAAFPEAPVTPAGFVQQAIDMAGHRLVLLDTLDEGGTPEHSGTLCADRLAWLETALAEADGRRVIVFTHHPPMDVGFAAMDAIGLTNRDAFLALVARHANTCQIISGHVHRTISGGAAGIPAAIFKSPCHQAPMMGPDMDTHGSVDEPGAYGVLFLGPGGVIVHSEDVDIPGRRPLSYT